MIRPVVAGCVADKFISFMWSQYAELKGNASACVNGRLTPLYIATTNVAA